MALLKEGRWLNAGNTATTGTAGSSGSVTSDVQNLNSLPETYLTLASASNRENPLPVYQVQLHLTPEPTGLLLTGAVSGFAGMVNARMESSTDKKQFQALTERTSSGQNTSFSFRDTSGQTSVRFYRLAVVTADGREYYSRIIPYLSSGLGIERLRVYPVPADQLITMSSAATVESDTLNLDTYIDGPVRKLGLAGQSVCYFPVGKENRLRWVKLRDASGDYTVEFFKGDPLSLGKVLDTALDHLSAIEYWSIRSTANAQASFVLSFDNVNSGGVTNPGDLRVALLKEGRWLNAGNTATTGTAGSSGSVTSDVQNLNLSLIHI